MPKICKVDLNHKAISKALTAVGAYVISTHTLKNAFDILVFFRGQIYVIEIKSRTKAKLTPGEITCKEKVERTGVPYYIAYNISDALKIIGAIKE